MNFLSYFGLTLIVGSTVVTSLTIFVVGIYHLALYLQNHTPFTQLVVILGVGVFIFAIMAGINDWLNPENGRAVK